MYNYYWFKETIKSHKNINSINNIIYVLKFFQPLYNLYLCIETVI